MITNNDIIILISNSGETSELIQLINPLKLKKVKNNWYGRKQRFYFSQSIKF